MTEPIPIEGVQTPDEWCKHVSVTVHGRTGGDGTASRGTSRSPRTSSGGGSRGRPARCRYAAQFAPKQALRVGQVLPNC
jgi:hypothetical protein